MGEKWSYREYQVEEGLKPGSKHFQYFFNVSRGGEKKCNYCVWIEDEALSRFDPSGDFESIISSQKGSWNKWVQGKIEIGDLSSKVLRIGKKEQKEIELSEMKEHLSME